MDEVRMRALLEVVRRALIMVLGAVEDWLGKKRSIRPRRER